MTHSASTSTQSQNSSLDDATDDGSPSDLIALSIEGVSKSFPSVRGLDDITLDVRAGEVHAIVGENGAGKSTLMAIASGALAADRGTITIVGHPLTTISPTAARDLGLAICRQTPSLMGDLRVSENLAISVAPDHRPSWRRINRWSSSLLKPWEHNRRIDPKTFARSLDPATRFMVEITKAVSQRPRVLLLDEPTEALGVDEIELLFEMIRDLAGSGTAVVYISHRIPDVIRISDRISVLRDGVLRGTHETTSISEADIVQAIVGTPLEFSFPPKRVADVDAPIVVEVNDFRCEHVAGVGFEVRQGEILGISGVDGNGQAELIRALAGLLPSSGRVQVVGERTRVSTPARSQSAGFVYLPADRHEEGIWPGLGVRENITNPSLRDFTLAGFVRGRREARAAQILVDELGVKTASLETKISTLSGGNQQKVVIARAAMRKPRVILAHEPTQGVDVRSRLEIYRILREHVRTGAAIVVSSDVAELEGLCDRVLVMSRGRVVRELAGDDVSEAQMTETALMATHVADTSTRRRAETPFRRFITGDPAPVVGILAAVVALGAYTALNNDFFLSAYSIQGILALFAVLAFAAMAQ